MVRVCGFFKDITCLLPCFRGVKVLEGGQGGHNNFLSCPHCSLESVPLRFCGSSNPDCDECSQDGFNDSIVELGQQLL